MRGSEGAELSLDIGALAINWRRFSGYSDCVAAVVKAGAYGLGIESVAGVLFRLGCRIFYVAHACEGEELRLFLGSGVEVRVLNGPDESNVSILREHDLVPVLNSLHQISLWRSVGGGRAVLHLDTGMNRLGIPESDWGQACELWPRPCVLMSHLACADVPEHELNRRQLGYFQEVSACFPGVSKSLAASAGAALGQGYMLDEIRPGIGLYGGGPDIGGISPAQMVYLSAPVLQVRRLEPGMHVGYGAEYVLKEAPKDLACIAMGYADGVLRSGSKGGYAVVAGEKRRILGRISMDLSMLDVTGLGIEPGMRVQFLGPELPLNEQSCSLGVIPHELLTSLGLRVRRA